jgi:hypothetical protein
MLEKLGGSQSISRLILKINNFNLKLHYFRFIFWEIILHISCIFMRDIGHGQIGCKKTLYDITDGVKTII